MGVGGNARKQAQANQNQAYQNQLLATQKAEADAQAYKANFNTRNAGIIGLQQRSQGRLNRLEKGDDIGSIYNVLGNTLTEGADAVKQTMGYTQGLGTNALAQQDSRYNQKLQSVAQRQIASQMGRSLVGGVLGERDRDTGIVMDTSNYLSGDERYGLGMNQQNVSNYGSLFGNASTIRQMEMQRAQMAWSQMQGILSGASGLMSGLGGLGVGFGGSSGAFRATGGSGTAGS